MQKSNSLGSQNKVYDVIIIGAGHAGLAASYFLNKYPVEHLVIEKGKIGQSWKSRRWDSFKLNTPNWANALPGERPIHSSDPDKFSTAGQFVNALETYAHKFNLPVFENCEVLNLTKINDIFELVIKDEYSTDALRCKKIIIASGVNDGKLPALSNDLPPNIVQLHAKDYKSPGQLPDGAILVAGSGQSGTQITEDLLEHQRTVFLSCSGVSSMPRRYRGKDIFYWLSKLKILDMPTQLAIEKGQIRNRQPQISGLGTFGHSVDLAYLAGKGAILVGKIRSVQDQIIQVDQNVSADCKLARNVISGITNSIDKFISTNELDFPETESDFDIRSGHNLEFKYAEITQLDLDKNNIQSIIWATGFHANLNWIDIPSVKEENEPRHINGKSPVHGLYYIGFPWLRTRKSGIICGVEEDARLLIEEVVNNE